MGATFTDPEKIGVMNVVNVFEFTTCRVHLFSNNFTFTPDTLLTDLVKCTFTGYAPVNVAAFLAALLDDDGIPYVVSPTLRFASTGSTITETAYGWFITEQATPEVILKCGGNFAVPVPFSEAGQGVDFVVKVGQVLPTTDTVLV